jgi:hypothetical protein
MFNVFCIRTMVLYISISLLYELLRGTVQPSLVSQFKLDHNTIGTRRTLPTCGIRCYVTVVAYIYLSCDRRVP